MESSHGQLTQTRLQFGYLIRQRWIASRRRVVSAVERRKRIKVRSGRTESLYLTRLLAERAKHPLTYIIIYKITKIVRALR